MAIARLISTIRYGFPTRQVISPRGDDVARGSVSESRNKDTLLSKYNKVAQLVRCRIGNRRVAGSIPGRLGHFGLFLGNIVYPTLLQSTQLYNGYLA